MRNSLFDKSIGSEALTSNSLQRCAPPATHRTLPPSTMVLLNSRSNLQTPQCRAKSAVEFYLSSNRVVRRNSLKTTRSDKVSNIKCFLKVTCLLRTDRLRVEVLNSSSNIHCSKSWRGSLTKCC